MAHYGGPVMELYTAKEEIPKIGPALRAGWPIVGRVVSWVVTMCSGRLVSREISGDISSEKAPGECCA